MTIIAISGKAQSGKDTVGQIFQYLTTRIKHSYGFQDFKKNMDDITNFGSRYEIKKFAYKVKEITSLLTGIPIADLEKEEVKNNCLSKCWDYTTYMGNICSVDETYNQIVKDTGEMPTIGYMDSITSKMTVRQFMYQLATDAIRCNLHPDTWVNALFSEYDTIQRWKMQDKPSEYEKYPNWIITDWRFKNEGKAILERKGITIRVDRFIDLRYPKEYDDFIDNVGLDNINEKEFINYCKYKYPNLYNHLTHISETELDKSNYFKYVIHNNGDIENLITQCYDILLKEKLV